MYKYFTLLNEIFSKGATKFDGAVNAFIKHLGSLGVNVETPKKQDNIDKAPTSTGRPASVPKSGSSGNRY